MPHINRSLVVALLAGLAVLVGGVALNRAGSPEPSAPSASERQAVCAAPASTAGATIDLHPYAPADASITFVCCAYNPTVVTISAGESVSWSGNFSFPHPLRQVDGPTSDTPVPGGFANSTGTFYSHQFNTPGTYYYQCAFHGLAQFGGTMRGSVVVLPVAVTEVSNSLVISGSQTSTLSWNNSQGPFNVYRGVYAGSWAYNQTCFDANIPGPSTDAAVPPAGTMYYYLVSRRGTGGQESVIGRDSTGAAIPNTSPCP